MTDLTNWTDWYYKRRRTRGDYKKDRFDKLDRLVLEEKVDERGLRDDRFDRWDRLCLKEKRNLNGK